MDEQSLSEQLRFERAKKKVKALSGFYQHFAAYILVNAILFLIKYVIEPGFPFSAIATAFFWGIGLLAHALSVFGGNMFFGKDWEERKVKEILQKQVKKRWE